jgi:hypothetical protein
MPSEATRAKELAGLIERVENATGPDWGLDSAVFAACGMQINPKNSDYGRWPEEAVDGWGFYRIDRITASIDAAMALVERVDPRSWHVHLATALNTLWSSDTTFGEPLIAPDVPLALLPKHILLALLRALQESQDAQ